MKNLSLILVIIVFFSSLLTVNAQVDDPGVEEKKSDSHQISIGIPSHASLNIESAEKDLVFATLIPEVAGDKVSFTQTEGSDIWLNYSSIVASGDKNMITASISELPLGTEIELVVSETAATGAKGTTGAGQTVTLGTTESPVVIGIGSCFTGTGEAGHKLSYAVKLIEADYAKLVATDYDITVTYTIKDEN